MAKTLKFPSPTVGKMTKRGKMANTPPIRAPLKTNLPSKK